MRVNSMCVNMNNIYSKVTKNNKESSLDFVSNAVIKKENEDEVSGDFLGLTMLPEEGQRVVYGMVARLSENSSTENPIVQITSNANGEREVFDIEINKINPQNASRMEMFALCCYADKYGSGSGDTFGSFHTLKMLEETALQNGQLKKIDNVVSAWDQFRNVKVDWVEVGRAALDVLRYSNDSKVMDLFSKGGRLLHLFTKMQE